MKTEFIGNYKDLNGSIVRVVFESGRYFYEVVDGIPDQWVSNQPPERHSDLRYVPSK